MNCVELFVAQALKNSNQTALWIPGHRPVTFGELLELSKSAQGHLKKLGLGPGDTVLLLEGLSTNLYGAVIGLLSLGVTVVLVEPWMPVEKINQVIRTMKPKLFLTNWFGRFWGMRASSIREIPIWKNVSSILSGEKDGFSIQSVDPSLPGIITFTSGTTGQPKGVVRKQGYLVEQHKVLSKNLDPDLKGPDLCIFANFALLNLASGRTTVLVPPKWKAKDLLEISRLPTNLQPESLTCGPAFLLRLMENGNFNSLKSIHIGGALTDCDIFEKAFSLWPASHISHIYGSSEVEPVALVDAKIAVKNSREAGYFQTLNLGVPVPEITPSLEENGLWVTGPHVCPEYVGSAIENKINKRRDEKQRVWHFMGDRITEDSKGWWYSGRSAQSIEDFKLEQKVYSFLKSSKTFVHRKGNELHLLGDLKKREAELKKYLPQIVSFTQCEIIRDNRHRARIDRNQTLKKGAPWLVG